MRLKSQEIFLLGGKKKPPERRLLRRKGLPEVVYPKGIKLISLSEEHCKCIIEEENDLKVGDKIFLRPMHSDTTINLHDDYFVHRDGILEESVPIAGRGKFK